MLEVRSLAHLAILCSAWMFAACASERALPASTVRESSLSTKLAWEEVTLGPGDLVRVSLHAHPELSTPVVANLSGTRVGVDGFLSLPLIGPIQVRGLSVERARESITAAFAQYVKAPKVDISVVEYASRRFYLYGEVQKPGTFVLDRPLTLYQALAHGGGFTPRARRDEIVLLRGDPSHLEVVVFDGEQPETKGMTAIRPDDFVFVRRSGAGRFADEILPILSGIGSTLSSIATVILIQDKLTN